MRTLTVPAGITAIRLDRFLAEVLPDCSRRTAQRAIAGGDVRIDGRRARKGAYLHAGNAVQVPDLLDDAPLAPSRDLEIPVLYEDAALLALDKPPGIPSHALRAHETRTVANFLLARYPETAAVGKTRFEPGIVHRLDTDTSGVLLVARTAAAYRSLRQQFAAHAVTKEYLAVVHGVVSQPGTVRSAIMPAPHNRRKMRVCPPGNDGQPAITTYRPRERLPAYTLLAVEIRTGVRHQVRVHLASIGHPVVGDRLYGSPAFEGGPVRHLLHAARIECQHPTTGSRLQLTSAAPTDLRAFLAAVR